VHVEDEGYISRWNLLGFLPDREEAPEAEMVAQTLISGSPARWGASPSSPCFPGPEEAR
jgi:hypothetical protein